MSSFNCLSIATSTWFLQAQGHIFECSVSVKRIVVANPWSPILVQVRNQRFDLWYILISDRFNHRSKRHQKIFKNLRDGVAGGPSWPECTQNLWVRRELLRTTQHSLWSTLKQCLFSVQFKTLLPKFPNGTSSNDAISNVCNSWMLSLSPYVQSDIAFAEVQQRLQWSGRLIRAGHISHTCSLLESLLNCLTVAIGCHFCSHCA